MITTGEFMLISYNGHEIDFNQAHSISVEGDEIIFHNDKKRDHVLKLGSEYTEVAEDVTEYIAGCYQKGFKKLNLTAYLASSPIL
ncbi:hypothetical protein [Piscirickettsia salmonis]|nr:hypothetical protein [Piscirickettsia salmonis]QGO71943.1 hypothetical protein Psal081_03456 [Piscirickettsia salmonis]